MLLTLFLTCFVSLAAATVLLLAFGDRVRVASRVLGLALGVVLAVAAGQAAARLWQLDPRPVLVAEALLVVLTVVVVAARPLWNPVGQVFLASFAAAALAYLSFAATVTFAGGLAPAGVAASALLLALETSALLLSGSVAFESCDVLCRVRWSRPPPLFDPAHRPKVSLHVPAYNEPPDMLIETIRSLDRLDYPNYEIVVIDNNTKDPAVWHPVAAGASHAGGSASSTSSTSLAINGTAYQGDPTTLPLASYQELVVAFGTASQLPSPIPSTYQFPSGE